MKAEIITIGDELLQGSVENVNYRVISKFLYELGITVVQHTSIRDSVEAIVRALEQAKNNADMIICTGGLGPTSDDVTREAAAKFMGVKLVDDPDMREKLSLNIPDSWGKKQKEFHEFSSIPEGGTWLENTVGVVPGIFVDLGKNLLFFLPGVPIEMETMLTNEVLRILKKYKMDREIYSITFRTVGIPEIQIHRKIEKHIPAVGVDLAYYPSFKGVDLIVTAKKTYRKDLDKFRKEIEEALGLHVFSKSKLEFEDVIGQMLANQQKRLSVAESCTGGMLASTLINVSGASSYFPLGIVTYSNEAKITELNVDKNLLEKHGAVSKEVAEAMARGILEKSSTDYSLALSGVAGPTGGTPEKPVGLVFIALADEKNIHVRKYNFIGSRNVVRQQAVMSALFMLWLKLNNTLESFKFNDGSKKV